MKYYASGATFSIFLLNAVDEAYKESKCFGGGYCC